MYLRQKWRDARLSFGSADEQRSIRAYVWDDIWVPDTFFRQDISSSAATYDITVENKFLTISNTGEVWYVQK